MRWVNPAAQALREQGVPLYEPTMMLITPFDRAVKGATVDPIGIWYGDDAEDILIQDINTGVATTRTFYRGLTKQIEVTEEVGLDILPLTVELSRLEPAVRIAFYQHEPRGAVVQIFRRTYDPATLRPVAGVPEALWLGKVNKAPDSSVIEGQSVITVDLVSSARVLTIPSGLTKSDAAQSKRMGDRFRRYKSTTKDWDVIWEGDKD